MRERTLEELNSLKKNLQIKSIVELALFVQSLDGLDFTGLSAVVAEIERRLQQEHDDAYESGLEEGCASD